MLPSQPVYSYIIIYRSVNDLICIHASGTSFDIPSCTWQCTDALQHMQFLILYRNLTTGDLAYLVLHLMLIE